MTKILMMQKIKSIIEDTDTLSGKVFAYFIQTLIIYSLITFSIATLPDLSIGTLHFLEISRLITVTIFTLEYVLRVLVADKKMSYIFSFFGLIDLLAILPFYLSLTVLRIFRILKIGRYNKALQRFSFMMKDLKEEFLIFFTTTLFLIYLSGVGIYYFENTVQPENFKSIFHSIWWAIATLTTVGYGDIYPITTGGKIFTFIMLMIGLGIVSVPAGLISSAMQKANNKIPD